MAIDCEPSENSIKHGARKWGLPRLLASLVPTIVRMSIAPIGINRNCRVIAEETRFEAFSMGAIMSPARDDDGARKYRLPLLENCNAIGNFSLSTTVCLWRPLDSIGGLTP